MASPATDRRSASAVSSRLGAAAYAAPDRADPSRPRRWFCRDLSGLAERKKPACLGCNPRARAFTYRSGAALSRRSVARHARGATPADVS